MPLRRTPETQELDWQGLLETALTVPGNIGNTYSRLHDYSYMNQMLLLMQGVEPQPIASYRRWQALGRQVMRGAKAKTIVTPVIVNKTDEETGERKKRLVGFKPKACVFPYEDTEGQELPPVEPREWNLNQALDKLDIERVPFALMDGNCQGYSVGNTYAINPVAVNPLKTTVHELAHITAGHTSPEQLAEYSTHRGIKEFVAEGTAYLVLNELDELTESQASESRGYISGWLRGQTPPESEVRNVFSATDRILRAGRLALSTEVEAA